MKKKSSLYKLINKASIIDDGIDRHQFKQIREELGFTQPQMAKEIGLTRRHIIYIERGEGKFMRATQLAAILLYLIHKNDRT